MKIIKNFFLRNEVCYFINEGLLEIISFFSSNVESPKISYAIL